ncbi:ATP-binding cassette domain-containing protein [Natrinema altunense]|uniref:ATP-binding cassette domain-containing protein n=1 Tax=Natrinema altunense TaxID=222984 RepID=A0A482Y617_9EURY|nr:ATP-binding cassette domain-containing protein [Natrinema altunense]
MGIDSSETLERYPHELSGGEAQRVSLAVALASDPDLLLADEPTIALDATTQAAILDLLADLVAERDLATLLVSHDPGLVRDYCDRIAVAYAVGVVESGPAGRVLTAPRHPYTQALLACRLTGTTPGERLPTIDGSVPDPATESSGCPFASRCSHATDVCHTTAPPTVGFAVANSRRSSPRPDQPPPDRPRPYTTTATRPSRRRPPVAIPPIAATHSSLCTPCLSGIRPPTRGSRACAAASDTFKPSTMFRSPSAVAKPSVSSARAVPGNRLLSICFLASSPRRPGRSPSTATPSARSPIGRAPNSPPSDGSFSTRARVVAGRPRRADSRAGRLRSCAGV